MAGQVWSVNDLGGYMYSDQLSNYLRMQLTPMMRYRNFCDIQEAIGYGKGENFNWNIYGDLKDDGGELKENEAIGETSFSISQATLKITEYGNSVPFTKKLDDLSKHPAQEVIKKNLKRSCAKVLDKEAHKKFAETLVKVCPTGGNDADSVAITEDGTASAKNDAALSLTHVKEIIDEMKERDIPGYENDDYFAIGRPRTFRPFKNELEKVYQYTESGMRRLYLGEIGQYDGMRFVEQTNVANQGWSNKKSDEVFFMGADTVVEAIVEFEQIRGKIPTDYGRSKGIAWYYLGGFGISHNNPDNPSQNRILHWTSKEA